MTVLFQLRANCLRQQLLFQTVRYGLLNTGHSNFLFDWSILNESASCDHSDRDLAVVAQLWLQIFRCLEVDLLYSDAWCPQMDDR